MQFIDNFVVFNLLNEVELLHVQSSFFEVVEP